jgi:hypothetical protein
MISSSSCGCSIILLSIDLSNGCQLTCACSGGGNLVSACVPLLSAEDNFCTGNLLTTMATHGLLRNWLRRTRRIGRVNAVPNLGVIEEFGFDSYGRKKRNIMKRDFLIENMAFGNGCLGPSMPTHGPLSRYVVTKFIFIFRMTFLA